MLHGILDAPDLKGAACAGTDPDVWFAGEREGAEPGSAGYSLPVSTIDLLAVCYSCPVQRRCADWALSVGEAPYFSGVVGGLRPADRKLLWRHRRDPRYPELLEALFARNRPLPPGRDPGTGARARRPPLPAWAR